LRYTEIIEVLTILSENDDQKARALGILKEMNTLSFIKISHAMESLLRAIHCASKALQDCSIVKNGININKKKNPRKTCLNKNLLELYIETTVGQSNKNKSSELSKDLKIIFFSAVDRYVPTTKII